MWKYALQLYVAVIICGLVVGKKEPEPYTEEWADETFFVMGHSLKSILAHFYHRNIRKYLAERPVTANSISSFLYHTILKDSRDVCGRFDNTELLFKKVHKTNPIECYTGREYNATRNMESLAEFGKVLIPHGNSTKRSLPGNCVFVMFYTSDCISSRIVYAEFMNAAKFFPKIQWVILDSLRFYSLNADFGVTGLPTLMLFHQGKPARKYNLAQPTAMRLIKFLWQNTNLEPSEDAKYNLDDDFHLGAPKAVYDPYLDVAWGFIILCIVHYFVQTAVFKKFVNFIKQSWHESGIQHEHND